MSMEDEDEMLIFPLNLDDVHLKELQNNEHSASLFLFLTNFSSLTYFAKNAIEKFKIVDCRRFSFETCT